MYILWLLKLLGVLFVESLPINKKNSKIVRKRPPGEFVYRGIRFFDPVPSNPTTFLGLCSPGDYRQSIESPMGVPTFNSTEKALTFTIYDCILRIRPKRCVI